MDKSLIVNTATVLNTDVKELVKLHGDASYRTYYRAITADGQSYIIMQMPEGKQSVSEEITNFNGTHQELPFINVSKYLKKCSLPVPSIIAEDHANHILILEDLGDRLMANLVDGKSEQDQRRWYYKAIDLLVQMQKQTEDFGEKTCIAFQRSFDSTLLDWEFDHFLEYGIEARLCKKMGSNDLALFKKITRSISEEIQGFPYGFTHRDFQSRNLILNNDILYMIDFQDALMGPRAYDLAALLRDSYVQLSSDLVRELVAYYVRKRNFDEHEVTREFDMITIQRKLKDAGRFVFIDRVKKNPKFLKNIPASLGYVKEAFERLPEYRQLYEMLIEYVPEWQ